MKVFLGLFSHFSNFLALMVISYQKAHETNDTPNLTLAKIMVEEVDEYNKPAIS